MSDGLRVELSEDALVASPGGAATVRCTVYNASFIVDEYRLTVEGIDPSWVEIPPMTNRIFPESFETVSVVFRPPRSAAVAAGDFPFRIVATSSDNPSLSAIGTGVLTVEAFVGFSFDVASPRQSSGQTEGTWDFRLANSGNARLTIALTAADEQAQLDCAFAEPTVEVGPGEERTVRLTARARSAVIGTAPTLFQVTAHAQIVAAAPAMGAAESAPLSAVVIFQQTPISQEPPRLEPQVVELAGQMTETRLVLTNRGSVPVTFALEASDPAQILAFEFVGGPRVQVPAGEAATVPLRITCPDRAKLPPPPSSVHFTVVSTPVDPSGDPSSVNGQVTTPSPADFRLRLEPELVEGTGPARVSLLVENVSPRAATFSVAAFSRETGLQVSVGQAQVEIPAHERVTLPVDLTPLDGLQPGPNGAPKASGFTLRVAPLDAPTRSNEVSGQYVLTPPAIALRLARKEIEAPDEAVFDLQIENQGRSEVSVVLEASDPAGACAYTFDLPRLRIAPRAVAPVRLTVNPPDDHAADARWTFEVLVRPIAPAGPPVRAEGTIIYRAPSLGLTLDPPERRGRRARTYRVIVSNPTPTQITARLSAVDRSGGLGVVLKQEGLVVPPSGQGVVKVPIRVTPWKRTKGSGAQALTFGVAATPITPPGDATAVEGRFVALPPRSKWLWVLLALLLLIAFLLSPLYEQAFYLAGWEKGFPNEEHHFVDDVECSWDTAWDTGPGDIVGKCFEQGIRPTEVPEGLIGALPGAKTTGASTIAPRFLDVAAPPSS